VNSIRWKIILLCIVVMLVPVTAINFYSRDIFDRFTRHELEKQMIGAAFMVGEQVKAVCGDNGSLDETRKSAIADLGDACSRKLEVRIQVLSTNGIVLTDSGTNAIIGVNLAGRPEVQSALNGNYKARAALTADRSYMFYFVAYPIQKSGKTIGAVYLSRTTSPIIRTINRMILFQRITTLLAVILGAILAVFFSHTITNRLRQLTKATAQFAKGTAPLNVTMKGTDEVGELATAVHRMAEEIHRTNRYNRDFISAVIHELKMPITAIKGAAELLEQGAMDKKDVRDKFLGNIHFESDRLARFVLELNELTKLDTEGLHLRKERVAYGACISDILERFKTTIDSPHPNITVSLPENECVVMINQDRIEQVLCNLLDNAVRYTPPSGSITIKAEEMSAGTVVTSVHDTGCGISPSNLGKVFDRFFTTEPKDKLKNYGSGLGLAIARSIVENHNGKIRVESTPGNGTTFFFTLPLA